jgi:hypothetical protein
MRSAFTLTRSRARFADRMRIGLVLWWTSVRSDRSSLTGCRLPGGSCGDPRPHRGLSSQAVATFAQVHVDADERRDDAQPRGACVVTRYRENSI